MRAFVSRIANLLLVASLAVSCQHATDVASKGGTREQIEVPLLARNPPAPKRGGHRRAPYGEDDVHPVEPRSPTVLQNGELR